MTVPGKLKKREGRREEKAEKAAQLDKVRIHYFCITSADSSYFAILSWLYVSPQNIEKELLERLEKGVYGDIYNYPVKQYMDILDKNEMKVTADEDEDEDEVCFMDHIWSIFSTVVMFYIYILPFYRN